MTEYSHKMARRPLGLVHGANGQIQYSAVTGTTWDVIYLNGTTWYRSRVMPFAYPHRGFASLGNQTSGHKVML